MRPPSVPRPSPPPPQCGRLLPRATPPTCAGPTSSAHRSATTTTDVGHLHDSSVDGILYAAIDGRRRAEHGSWQGRVAVSCHRAATPTTMRPPPATPHQPVPPVLVSHRRVATLGRETAVTGGAALAPIKHATHLKAARLCGAPPAVTQHLLLTAYRAYPAICGHITVAYKSGVGRRGGKRQLNHRSRQHGVIKTVATARAAPIAAAARQTARRDGGVLAGEETAPIPLQRSNRFSAVGGQTMAKLFCQPARYLILSVA